MIVKALEIRDRMTFIPVIAINTAPASEGQRYLLRRAGYAPGGDTIIVVRLNDGRAANDPYDWNEGGARTMSVAHDYIQRHFYQLADGGVVDAEFIAGESPLPKVSERLEHPGS